MRKIVLASALIALAGAPAMACEYMKSVSTPVPEEDVVMTPAPTAPPVATAAEEG
jgi:hypothetical protein